MLTGYFMEDLPVGAGFETVLGVGVLAVEAVRVAVVKVGTKYY